MKKHRLQLEESDSRQSEMEVCKLKDVINKTSNVNIVLSLFILSYLFYYQSNSLTPGRKNNISLSFISINRRARKIFNNNCKERIMKIITFYRIRESTRRNLSSLMKPASIDLRRTSVPEEII